MALLGETLLATIAALAVTSSFPLYLYGAWIVIENDPVTWSVLKRHLKYILTGLALTTIPVLTWMAPRLFDQLSGLAALHAFLGLQAYAMLAFALTGIVRIFLAKRRYDLYHDYDADILLEEIGSENMAFWRRRLRIGVFGYVLFWILAFVVGLGRYVIKYQPLGAL
jgi:hypothetical protein